VLFGQAVSESSSIETKCDNHSKAAFDSTAPHRLHSHRQPLPGKGPHTWFCFTQQINTESGPRGLRLKPSGNLLVVIKTTTPCRQRA